MQTLQIAPSIFYLLKDMDIVQRMMEVSPAPSYRSVCVCVDMEGTFSGEDLIYPLFCELNLDHGMLCASHIQSVG